MNGYISRLIFFILVILLFLTCSNTQDRIQRLDYGLIENDNIDEASGIDRSLKNKDIFWLHNDSGDDAQIFAIDIKGKHLGRFKLSGINNRDWEDITVGLGPDENQTYIYIGEIGDNEAVYENKYIYRVIEPEIDLEFAPYDSVLRNIDIISFRYPDGPRDAETLMIDPQTKDIIIVSKREEKVHVYSLPFPQNTDSIIIADLMGILPVTKITGGDISDSGTKITLKNYEQIFYWKRDPGKSIAKTLSEVPGQLPYIAEPQGEAVCWAADEKGYYTVSEESEKSNARLYYYPFK